LDALNIPVPARSVSISGATSVLLSTTLFLKREANEILHSFVVTASKANLSGVPELIPRMIGSKGNHSAATAACCYQEVSIRLSTYNQGKIVIAEKARRSG